VVTLPTTCERALLERFLRAEAMALYSVRSSQEGVPPRVLEFLLRHEREEEEHLRRFEAMTGIRARGREALPKMPAQWHARAVHLLGYEALGLEFARLLASLRPDLAGILADEETHVAFFEAEVRRLIQAGEGPARGAREYARAWLRRLPRTVDRYLRAPELDPVRDELRERILRSIEARLRLLGALG
jgi:hypothetical protein